MEFLQVFYFLLVKLVTGGLLLVTFLIVPVLTLLFLVLVWPSEKHHSATECYVRPTGLVLVWPSEEHHATECYVRPTGFRWLWIGLTIAVGIICFGAQMNWIFNFPSPTFNKITYNFFEGYEKHRKEVEQHRPPTRTNLPTELRRYELISYNPPKHFYVTIEDVKTHTVFKQVYVSKHCNSASSNKIGDEYNIRVTPYTMSNQPGVVFYEFHSLYSVFCGG